MTVRTSKMPVFISVNYSGWKVKIVKKQPGIGWIWAVFWQKQLVKSIMDN